MYTTVIMCNRFTLANWLSVTNTSYTQSVDTNPSKEIYKGIGAAVVDRC